MPFEVPASSLPVVDGKIYHLAIGPEQLADYVIIVGDPDRVPKIAEKFFVEVDTDVYHRGLRTMTGTTANGTRITACTSGMGTPSLEIVLNELIALKKIDLATRTPLPASKPLTIIRVGTSGAVRSGTALGTCIVAKYSVGLDNAAIFLDVPAADEAVIPIEEKVTKALQDNAIEGARFASHVRPYAARANQQVVDALVEAAKEKDTPYKVGVTASAAGFFANQGRQLLEETRLTVPNVDSIVGSVDFSDIPAIEPKDIAVENLEMETATLFHIGYGAGFRCGSICVTIAQRRTGEFLCNQTEVIDKCFTAAVDAIEKIAKADA